MNYWVAMYRICEFRFWTREEPLGFDEQGHPAVEARALSANFEEDHPGVLPTL